MPVALSKVMLCECLSLVGPSSAMTKTGEANPLTPPALTVSDAPFSPEPGMATMYGENVPVSDSAFGSLGAEARRR
ncbi:MAG: hypothetical protein R2856_14105 [Caldilineaceae bacterium]